MDRKTGIRNPGIPRVFQRRILKTMADFRNRNANVLTYAIFLTVLAMGL